MKKVICICDDWESMGATLIDKCPKKDSIYTVVNERPCPCGCGVKGYELLEFPPLRTLVGEAIQLWRADWFRDLDEIQLSNVTVEELIREEVLELV